MSDSAPRASLHAIAATVRTNDGDAGPRLARLLGVPVTRMETLVVGLILGLAFAVIGIGPAVREHIAAPAADPVPAAAAAAPVATVAAPDAALGAIPPAVVRSGAGAAAAATPPRSANQPAEPAPAYADGGRFGSISVFAAVPDGVPAGLAVADDGSVYAAISDADGEALPRISRFSPSGDIDASWNVGTEPTTLTGVALAGDGAVLALSSSPASVVRIDPATGAQSIVAVFEDLPPCVPVLVTERCEPPPFDNPPRPTGILVLGDGSALVTDAGQATVWQLPAGGGATIWHQSQDYVAGEGQTGLAALTVADDRILLSVGVTALSTGGVVEIALTDEGAASDATWRYRAAPGEAPAGIAAGDDGHAYLALSGTNELLVIAPNGTVAKRIAPSEPGELAAPDGVARRGRSVLVSNRSSDVPSIVRVSVTDGSGP